MTDERVLDLAALDAPGGLAMVRRIAWERAAPGYRREPGRWRWGQNTLQVTLRGCGACWPDGTPASLRRLPVGSALLYANRAHRRLVYGSVDEDGPYEFLYLNLVGAAADAAIADLAALHGHVVPFAADHPLVREALALLPATSAHAVWPLARSAALAQRILLAVTEALAASTAAPADDRLVAEAMRRLGAAPGVDVAAVARALGVSREHLTRVFARRVGEPPARWRRHRRLDAAAARLRGGAAVAAVAKAAGFADAAHFAAVFRQRFGLAPSAFRRREGPG